MALPDEYLYELEMAEARDEVRQCEALLSKLSVSDLRVLARRYWKIDEAEAAGISKRDLVRDLATENAPEILDDMWRTRKRQTAA